MEQPGAADDGAADPVFRLGFVPGATPAKWARVWQERHPSTPLHLVPVPADAAEPALLAGDLEAAILRPPVDRDRLHAIVLYREEPVVVVPRDHLLAALGESEAADPADLADEVLLQPADDVLAWAGRPGADEGAIAVPGRLPREVPATTKEAIELVAAGVGVVVVPRSLARLHHRKDVTARVLAGGPEAPVVLAWVIERADERTEDLVGIVRGRTVNSSRGRAQEGAPAARETSAANGARRATRRKQQHTRRRRR